MKAETVRKKSIVIIPSIKEEEKVIPVKRCVTGSIKNIHDHAIHV